MLVVWQIVNKVREIAEPDEDATTGHPCRQYGAHACIEGSEAHDCLLFPDALCFLSQIVHRVKDVARSDGTATTEDLADIMGNLGVSKDQRLVDAVAIVATRGNGGVFDIKNVNNSLTQIVNPQMKHGKCTHLILQSRVIHLIAGTV